MCKVLIAAYIQKFKGKGELNLYIIRSLGSKGFTIDTK